MQRSSSGQMEPPGHNTEPLFCGGICWQISIPVLSISGAMLGFLNGYKMLLEGWKSLKFSFLKPPNTHMETNIAIQQPV